MTPMKPTEAWAVVREDGSVRDVELIESSPYEKRELARVGQRLARVTITEGDVATDAERLDWLAYRWVPGGDSISQAILQPFGNDLRKAIDAARAAEKPAPPAASGTEEKP